MKLKLSELKKIIRENVDAVIREKFSQGEVDPSGQGETAVNSLFEKGSMVVTFSEIEDLAFEMEKDVDRAEALYEKLVEYAREAAPELGYLPDARGEFFVKRNTTQKFMKDYSKGVKSPVKADDDGFVGNTELQESKLSILKKIIKEAIEEVKSEDSKSIEESMKAVLRMLKEQNKSLSLRKNRSGNFEVGGCSPTQIEIRPMMKDSFDVIFIKNGTDREKKMNLNLKGVKDYLKEKLDDKNLDYKQSAFNKAASQVEDETKKTSGLPTTKINDLKKVGDTKKDDLDFNKKEVEKDVDLPDKPLAEVGDVKNQSSHDSDSGKAKYTFPKQDKEEKKHVLKGGKGKELKLPEKKIKKK